jgi:hypothetical protein
VDLETDGVIQDVNTSGCAGPGTLDKRHGPGQVRIVTYGDGATNAIYDDLFLVNPAGPALDGTKALVAAYNASGDPRLGEDQGLGGRGGVFAGRRRFLQLGRHQGEPQDREAQRRQGLDACTVY